MWPQNVLPSEKGMLYESEVEEFKGVEAVFEKVRDDVIKVSVRKLSGDKFNYEIEVKKLKDKLEPVDKHRRKETKGFDSMAVYFAYVEMTEKLMHYIGQICFSSVEPS
ncbi:hypothetical protein [Deinococcus sp.]|uniref:hypothetical protein n=1 Tax=Deinococcus sp. TaxID=47478 RepID=UPI003CC68B40